MEAVSSSLASFISYDYAYVAISALDPARPTDHPFHYHSVRDFGSSPTPFVFYQFDPHLLFQANRRKF